jgi:hypothetical protein
LEMGSWALFLRLTSNCNPPVFSLLSSWDYRSEPLVPSWFYTFLHTCATMSNVWQCLLYSKKCYKCIAFPVVLKHLPFEIDPLSTLPHTGISSPKWLHQFTVDQHCLMVSPS